MAVIDVAGLSYRYGSVHALRGLDLTVPEGALYALLGPNGSGKTTLLQILTGLRRAQAGRVEIMGVDAAKLTLRDRAAISYVAEGQALPKGMRLAELEAYLAPLYPTWDAALARDLRERFGLDPARKIGTLSRGQYMKAALLCALAPRPKLLVMDEPFTGMDALVKDDLVRGLLDSAGSEGWTVLLCSHDIGELELLADWVGILIDGRMRLAEPMDAIRQRCKHVTVVADAAARPLDAAWLAVERGGRRTSFVVRDAPNDLETRVLPAHFPGAERVEVREASLRELFVALARRSAAPGAAATTADSTREAA